MSKCTAAQALEAMSYWVGYREKATAKYATLRDRAYFETDAGSNNYTYAGYYCGLNGQPWCAMQVTLAICEACGSTADAKGVMHGVYPYTACNQLYDAAPAACKGRRGAWTPEPGDVIVFTDDGAARTHTGMVYAADGTYVYTYEGNSSDMCRKRSYLMTSAYIYGYVRPDYAAGGAAETAGELYGGVVYADIGLHELSKGCAGPEVAAAQSLLLGHGITDDAGADIAVDGDFGKKTKQAVLKAQAALGLQADGVVGAKTWAAMLTAEW